MTLLTLDHVFDPQLPADQAVLLTALAELRRLTRDKAQPEPERQLRARALYGELLAQSALHPASIPEDLNLQSPGFRRWFSEAVLLWMRYAETSSAPLVDTAGTRTLAKFPIDFPVDSAARERMRSALKRAFAWSTEEFAELEAKVAHLTSNLDVKLSITACVAEFLAEQAGGPRDPRLVLMDALYGALPWRAGDVDWVITRTSIFPCVPRANLKLLVSDWDERSQAERDELSAFMRKLRDANTANTLRFPAFGLAPERPAEPLLGRLLERTQLPEQVVLDTLQTMVMIVPTHQVDQYVIHDSWGHTWQEALSEFEWEYARVLELDQDLTPGAGPPFGGPVPTFGECFREESDQLGVDYPALLASARADVLGRLSVACSIALSEMLADFMESKFARAVPDAALPTSSLIDVARLKLDLSLEDLGRQLVRLSLPYRRLLEPDVQARFAAELGESFPGVTQPALLAAVGQAAQQIWQDLGWALGDELGPESRAAASQRPTAGPTPEPETNGVSSSLYRRAMLQLLFIAAELEHALAAPGGDWEDPASSPDFFCIAMTHLYEQDRARNFWHMNHVMRVAFAPACEQLKQALAG